MASSPDVIVVGGGIAGLSAAYHLSFGSRVLLIEREPVLAAHASGRNAAIYRPFELDETTAPLAHQTLATFPEFMDVDPLQRTGILFPTADRDHGARLAAHAAVQGIDHALLDSAEACERAPALRGGLVQSALWVGEGGVLDIHEILSGLSRSARERGAQLRTGLGVAGVQTAGGRVTGVTMDDGSRIVAPRVVIAGGAWARELGAGCGAPLPLGPVRRHLVHLDHTGSAPVGSPVVWRLDEEVYFRPELGGLLASPCDATDWEAAEPPADAAVLEMLAERLAAIAPDLGVRQVRSYWACLRTFAPDRDLVVGPDPRIEGLSWFGGLGGRGMSVAIAAGAWLTEDSISDSNRLRDRCLPGRLLAAG